VKAKSIWVIPEGGMREKYPPENASEASGATRDGVARGAGSRGSKIGDLRRADDEAET
jgi:hypothetical protein